MKNVVVIDDDDDVRDVIVFALENEGFKVLAFNNGKQGLDGLLLMQEIPGLIIVDYLMPEMDGISFINIVRSRFPDTLGKIPMAISSAMGASDPVFSKIPDLILLHKPMDLEDLLRIARECCA